jgi:hypothetical protein
VEKFETFLESLPVKRELNSEYKNRKLEQISSKRTFLENKTD